MRDISVRDIHAISDFITGPHMTSRTSIATAALIAFTNAAPAQEVSGRLDLEAIAPLGPWARLVTARVLFAKNDVT